jgi:hypothetical protein
MFSLQKMTDLKISRKIKLAWCTVTAIQNADAFWDTFNTLIELHFPITFFKFNKNLHSWYEFMTQGWLISRKKKIEFQ